MKGWNNTKHCLCTYKQILLNLSWKSSLVDFLQHPTVFIYFHHVIVFSNKKSQIINKHPAEKSPCKTPVIKDKEKDDEENDKNCIL